MTMAILYDRTGNEVFVEDDEVAEKLEETWMVHHRVEPRYFLENPDTRTDQEKAVEGAKRAHLRARKKIERAVLNGVFKADEFKAELATEIANVKAELLTSGDPKLMAIGKLL